jgi:copper(I)-binding protein
MPNRLVVTLLALLMATGMATAKAEITVEGVWSRATAPGLDRETIEGGGNSRMVHTPEVRVPAEGEVVFEPGGRHVMLMGLTESLREGETFELTLELEHNGPVTLTVNVLPPTAMGADD